MRRLFLFCSLAILASGCGLFTTRTPEPPTSGSTFIWTPATSVSYLLDNFTGTLQAMDGSNYMRVFIGPSDSTGSGAKNFVFTPAPGLDQGSRNVFTIWTPQSEQQWLSKLQSLLPKGSQLTVILSNPVTDQTASSSATFSADYTISIPVATSSNAIPSVVQGSLQMQMIFVTTDQGTKEWRVVSWSDFLPKSGTGPTWTDLKVKLSS